MQDWARQSTDPAAVFIVPPESVGFRIGAERTSYGDWKDGTLGFFDPNFAREWMRRMRVLGFDSDRSEIGASGVRQDFRALTMEAVSAIAGDGWDDPGPLYVVLRADAEPLPLPVSYENARFVVHRYTE